MKKENKIEKMIRSGLQEEPEPIELDKEWLKLESRLEVKEFFTFYWNRFNVYYLASFIASLGMAASALYISMTRTQATSPRPQSVGIFSDTVYVERILRDTVVIHKKQGTNFPVSAKHEKTMSTTLPEANTQKAVKKLANEENIAPNVEEAFVPESKKIVYQYKRDTIVKFDSVKLTKRQWKKMQKAK